MQWAVANINFCGLRVIKQKVQLQQIFKHMITVQDLSIVVRIIYRYTKGSFKVELTYMWQLLNAKSAVVVSTGRDI